MRQIAWLQDQLNLDAKVAGQCLFGMWGNGQWPGFDMVSTQMVDLIAKYNAGHNS